MTEAQRDAAVADVRGAQLAQLQAKGKWRTNYVLPDDGVKLDDVEHDLIMQALMRTNGNQVQAAKLLGITRFQLRYRAEKYGISV